MTILSNKYIPLKIHTIDKGIRFAWHWWWSMTWRWLIDWKYCKTNFSIVKIKNTSNGHSFTRIRMGWLGELKITTRRNMKQ